MTVKLRRIPFFGEGVYSGTAVVTRQRRLNCYYEVRADGDKSKVVVLGTPGMSLWATIGSLLNSPMRGMLGTPSAMYVVAYDQFLELNSSGGTVASGTISTVSGNVSMAFNPTQVLIVTGAKGYIYTTASDTLAEITDAEFIDTATTCCFLNSFFIVNNPGTGEFYVSDSGNGTSWSALAFATASQYSDLLLAVDTLMGMLVTFSEYHMEFWQNVGASPEPFQYIANSANEYGLAAVWSRTHVDNGINFLCQTREGGIQVARVQGYQVGIISTSDIDDILQSFTTVSDAVGLTYQVGDHKFYQLTFPTENRSFLYDQTTGIWSEAQTGLTGDYAQRHIGQFSVVARGQTYISDYNSAKVYTPEPSVYTDNGETIPREIITLHASNEFNPFRVASIYLDMDTGVGLTTGQGSDPQMMMDVSKDNGRTWKVRERWASIGAVGEYTTRVIWRRVIRGRDVVVRFRMTDPVKFVITAGAAIIGVRQ